MSEAVSRSKAAIAQPHPHVVGFAAAALAVIVVDVLTKVIVVAELSDRAPVRLLGGALYLVQTRNSGAAFSVGTGATIVFSVVAVVIAGLILRAARRLYSRGWALSLGLILGGAVGNLADRIFRAPGPGRGHVVDWLSLFADDGHIWPVFNVADSAVVCGAVLAAVLSIRGIDLSGNRHDSSPVAGDEKQSVAEQKAQPE